MLVDSHCHLDRIDLGPFEGSLDRALDAAIAAGVERFLCVAIDLEQWPAMVEAVSHRPEVSVSVGVHPSEKQGREPSVAELTERAAHPKVVAIGETGLDYYYGKDDKDRQRAYFRTHVAAAAACGKPLIVHTRDAKADTLAILREARDQGVNGVLHCFTEDRDMAGQALDLGFYISFSGILTFRNAESLREVARHVPLDRVLVETDSPYLAPVPYRGKSNQPAWTRQVAQCLADLRDLPLEELARLTSDNYHRLFGAG